MKTENMQRRAEASLVALACAAFLGGCASYEHAKGTLQLKMDKPVEGIESLENATRLSPTDPGYKVDYLLKRETTVQDVLALAEKLRANGKLAEAQAAYEKALTMDRGNARARAALAALPQDGRFAKLLGEGEAFLAQGKLELALDRAGQVLEEHPQNRRATKLKEAVLDAHANLENDRAKAVANRSVLEKPVTLQFNDAPIRTVFEALSRSVGLNILLDRDVKPTARVTIFVKDIAVADAIDFILLQNQLERRQINSNTLMVYPSSDAKKAEYEDLTIRSFQVTNADIKYLSTMLKSMLKLREVAADERTGILVIRDTPERLHLAAKLIAVHDVADPEIMLEVEILEVTSSRRSNLGFLPPSSFSVTTPGALTLGALKQLRTNDLLASPLSATLNFKLEDTDAKLLASPRIRARNREKAKIMIGDRVPTITNTVTPLTTGSSVVTGNVTYQDVGLKLEFEPQVYANNEIGIKVSLEVSNIAAEFTDAQGGRSYQIGTRNANTNLRLKDGETQILGGLITDQDRNTASKIPGLGHLPVVGRIFGNNDGSDTRSEIVLAITPRIVRNLPAHTPEARNIFSGTLNVLREKPILTEPITLIRSVAPATGTVAPIGPAAGTTPAPAAPGAVSGGVLFNPLPTPSPSATQVPEGGGALLPVPPPMYVRPPVSR
ncbi:secretin N-terminal domain-containing protein [Ramlibacter sp.]|uniref:secretin N-terminal domain-containing protein n=1 Tax=Ramlibacter sp. TaxID=1917967 RepID=UPI00183D651D|nr:secretin N-terminal domain-containing protein [Ramlibacter sp.]MBA2674828.1 secretion protein [Ramlibacter sp.]